MKNLVRNNPTYRLKNLPVVKPIPLFFNGKTGFMGSIVRRPLNITSMWHYGFFYGFSENGTLLMLENNKNGVECVTWRDFLDDHPNFEFTYYEADPNRHKEILLRANERANEEYVGHLNNCEHFANYCVHNKFESFQANMATNLADALLSLIEMKLAFQEDPMFHDLLNDYNSFRELLKLDRKNDSLQEIINKRLNK